MFGVRLSRLFEDCSSYNELLGKVVICSYHFRKPAMTADFLNSAWNSLVHVLLSAAAVSSSSTSRLGARCARRQRSNTYSNVDSVSDALVATLGNEEVPRRPVSSREGEVSCLLRVFDISGGDGVDMKVTRFVPAVALFDRWEVLVWLVGSSVVRAARCRCL